MIRTSAREPDVHRRTSTHGASLTVGIAADKRFVGDLTLAMKAVNHQFQPAPTPEAFAGLLPAPNPDPRAPGPTRPAPDTRQVHVRNSPGYGAPRRSARPR